jgi:hypothetical protein
MSKKLDIARMEAAFKRAADKALHGTREERSGRFLLKQERQIDKHRVQSENRNLDKRKV